MITFHFHLQPQYKYELFHIYFTKWRMHSNLVVNCDVVSWVSCAYRRELIKFFFIRRAGRRAGWQWRHIFELRHILVYLFILRHACDEHVSTWAGHVSETALDFLSMCTCCRSGFFRRKILRLRSIIFNSAFEYDVIKCSLRPARSNVYFICSPTRSIA